MTYLVKARYLTDEEMVDVIMSTKFTSWKPKFSCMHNTGVPNLTQALSWSEAARNAWGDNLNSYYKSMGWHSGPVAVGTPFGFGIQLCDFAADGVHASCFNHVSWGVETIGDFRNGADDPKTGNGAKSVASTVNILAAQHLLMGWDPGDFEMGVKGLHFHIMCEADHHACPGNLIQLPGIVGMVRERMTSIKDGQKKPEVTITTNTTVTTNNDNIVVNNNEKQNPTPVTFILEPWPNEDAYPQFFSNMDLMYDRLVGYSGSHAIACGLTAQPEAESAFKINVVGDNESAYGICQWHEPRITAIKEGCGIDVKNAPFEKQVDAMWWELCHLETEALEHIKSASTAYEVGAAACKYYERAGAANAMEKRGMMSERIATRQSKRKAA